VTEGASTQQQQPSKASGKVSKASGKVSKASCQCGTQRLPQSQQLCVPSVPHSLRLPLQLRFTELILLALLLGECCCLRHVRRARAGRCC
jgi:hypothetical protein